MNNIFDVSITNIQHIKELQFSIDLSKNTLTCIAGKNSVGKTTLIRAIKNITSADTFSKTASPYIFNDDSNIQYRIDGKEYSFNYRRKLNTIDSNEIIDEKIKSNIFVELPIPHGIRFNLFQKLSDIDEELRTKISLSQYSIPNNLISFLSKIYNSDRFDNIKEVTIKNEKYYFILKENNFYIREDYFSSGEYFVIRLYKLIQKQCKLIVIDEIDISLDASAQTNLLTELREYCTSCQINIIFTTHSLPLMKTLLPSELYYMEGSNQKIEIKNVSYNYVKSILFGFKGWDKYILTEDEMISDYLNHLISEIEEKTFYSYKIIYIGGASNVINLMKRNDTEGFFSLKTNIISVLDGDTENKKFSNNDDRILFLPFNNIEHQLEIHYRNNEFNFEVSVTGSEKKYSKNLLKQIIKNGHMTILDVFKHINKAKKEETDELKKKLIKYLNA